MRLRSVIFVLSGLTVAAIAQGQQPATAALEEWVTLPLLRQPPQTVEAVEERMQLARSRLQEIAPTTQPTTDVADEGASRLRELRASLVQDWQTYLGRLERVKSLQQSISEASGEERIRQRNEEIASLEADTQRLLARPAEEVTEETLADLRTRVQKLDARIGSLAEMQSTRSAQLTSGFQQQQQKFEEELKNLRQRRQELRSRAPAEVPAATAPAAPGEDALSLERRRLDVQIATAELGLQALTWERQQTELQFKQDERLLAALRKTQEGLNRRLAALVEARSRSRLEVLEARRAEATQPAETALLDLKIFAERVLLRYFKNKERIDALEKRYPPRQLDRLRDRVNTSRGTWDRVIGSLEYRSGREVFDLYQRVKEEIEDFSARLAALQAHLDKTLAEVQELQTVRDRALQRFNALADVVHSAARDGTQSERTRLETEVVTLRAELNEAMRSAIVGANEVVGRLNEAVGLVQERLTAREPVEGQEPPKSLPLPNVRDELYWKRVTSRDSGILGTNWRAALAQARALLAGAFSTAPPARDTGPEDLEQLLPGDFDDIRTVRTDAGRLAERVSSALAAVPTGQWIRWSVILIAAVALGFLLYRLSRRRGVRLARQIADRYGQQSAEEHAVGEGLSARIDLLGWNMLGDLAIPLLIAAVVVIAASRMFEDRLVLALVAATAGLIVGAVALVRLIHHLFEAESPPHRPLPCNDAVARHYRWWIGTLIAYSLVLLLVPALLRIADLAPTLETGLIEVFKTGFLLLLLLFLLRKRRVLGLAGMAEAVHWGAILARMLYPAIVLVVAALFVLEIVGFGVLVTFVGQGLLLSAVVLIVAATISEYVIDLLHRYSESDVSGAAALRTATARSGRRTSSGEPAPVDEDEGRSSYVLTLFKVLVRLLAAAGAVLAILTIWNVPLRTEWLSPRLVGLGALVILIALLIDRIVYTALFSLHRTGRLPLSTTNIIRRWLRGVITVLTALTLVALGGWKIDSVWTFLTTVLAMVAIGFVAVWSMLSNILATLVILIWRPFNVGEHIEIQPDGLEGQVVDINFIYTILKTDEGERISVPNNLFAQKFIKRRPGRGRPKRTLAEQLESEKPLAE